MTSSTPRGVEFFRIDRSGSTRWLLVIGTLLVAVGASLIGVHLVHRIAAEEGHVVSLVGGLALAAGLVLTFGALAMVLFENVYLAIHDTHLLLHDNGKETKLAWGDLRAVELEAKTGTIVLRRADDAEPLRWFAGKTAKDVRARIDDARRKGAHGILRTDSDRPS